ncbi:MAG: hypothetical protein MJ131_06470, partial [Lachnospiraceae bacterium]|nr:hypothetical protein [Lachnospiraceae bacterium]
GESRAHLMLGNSIADVVHEFNKLRTGYDYEADTEIFEKAYLDISDFNDLSYDGSGGGPFTADIYVLHSG